MSAAKRNTRRGTSETPVPRHARGSTPFTRSQARAVSESRRVERVLRPRRQGFQRQVQTQQEEQGEQARMETEDEPGEARARPQEELIRAQIEVDPERQADVPGLAEGLAETRGGTQPPQEQAQEQAETEPPHEGHPPQQAQEQAETQQEQEQRQERARAWAQVQALAEIEAEARALALVHEHTRALAAAESEAEAQAQAAVLRQLQAYAETGVDAQAQQAQAQAEAAHMGTHDRARAQMQWKEEQDQATVEAQARLAEQEANPNRQELSPRQLRRRRPPNYFYPVSRGISEAASLYEARAEALGEVIEDSLLAADRGSDGEEGGEVFIRHGLVHDGDMTDPPRLTQLNLSVNMLLLGQITEDEWALARREENQRARAREVVLGNVLRGVRRRFDGWRRLVEWLRGVGEALEGGFEMEYDEGVEEEVDKGDDLAGEALEGGFEMEYDEGVEEEVDKGDDLAGVEEEEKGDDLAGFEDDVETDELGSEVMYC
ncbi:hypothetical protein MaudCBS49596_007128 [Microsporum audouinii]